MIAVIDLYSIKPFDKGTIVEVSKSTKGIITVEDHYEDGGLGETVKGALSEVDIPVYSIAVTKMPRSGQPEELLDYEGISRKKIVERVKELL